MNTEPVAKREAAIDAIHAKIGGMFQGFTGRALAAELVDTVLAALTTESRPEGLAREALVAARDGLLREAIHMEQDAPGEVLEDCGWWCRLCNDHVDGDRKTGPSATGHKAGCPIAKIEAALATPQTDAPASGEVDVPVTFYVWLAGIERDVRARDLTPHEIASLVTALRPTPPEEVRDSALEEARAMLIEQLHGIQSKVRHTGPWENFRLFGDRANEVGSADNYATGCFANFNRREEADAVVSLWNALPDILNALRTAKPEQAGAGECLTCGQPKHRHSGGFPNTCPIIATYRPGAPQRQNSGETSRG